MGGVPHIGIMRIQPGTTNDLSPVVQGAQYRTTHRASVVAILGSDAPKVLSRGCKFYNADRWTGRVLINTMCDWASKNPGCIPTHEVIRQWVMEVNKFHYPENKREIVIASTPDVMPLRMAMALVGGAYHEALHTKFSCRRDMTPQEVASIVIARWAKVIDWSKYVKALLDWSNIIEDIKIERRGCETYDGIHSRMCDLHDFVLDLEHKAHLVGMARTRKGLSAMGVVQCVFRDLGKGYETDLQAAALERYEQWNPLAFMLVTNGPLSPLVNEASELTSADDLGSLRVAMDVISVLANLHQDNDGGGPKDSSEDPNKKEVCPQCGANSTKLKVHPKSDGNGGRIHGKGIVTCIDCGWQKETNVNVKNPKDNGGQEESKNQEMSSEGFNPDDYNLDPTDSDKKDTGSENNREQEDTDESTEDDKNPCQQDTCNKDSDDGGPNSGDPRDEECECDLDQGGNNHHPHNEQGCDPDQSSGSSIDKDIPHDATKAKDDSGESGKGGAGAGGHKDTSKDEVDNDWSVLAKDINGDSQDTGVKDVGKALEEGIIGILEKEDARLKTDESPWRPFDTSQDKAELVKPSRKGKAQDMIDADAILTSVKAEVVYLRSRLRTIIKAMEMKGVARGVARGHTLSSRYLVETRGTIRDGQKPNRAFDRRGEIVDMTIACAVVLDESGSMNHLRVDATRIMMALTEPLDALNASTLVLGFRDIFDGGQNPVLDGGTYHRHYPIGYDIFKTFNERFRQVRWRMANTRADGGTPMADGIQFALNALSYRTEAYRFLFVITDGCPNWGHLNVMNYQLRLAKEVGIHVIGVGVGIGASYIKKVFPDHVWSDTMSEFPRLLVKKLNEFVDVQATKRGRLIKDTSK